MENLQEAVEAVVSCGIRAYIGLLCTGEKVRSRRLFKDTMEISSVASGGPSQRFATGFSQGEAAGMLGHHLVFFTLRSMLATLLVLRATAYWTIVPELAVLSDACAALGALLEGETPSDPQSSVPVRSSGT